MDEHKTEKQLNENLAQLHQEREKINLIAEMFGEVLLEYDIANDRAQYTRQNVENADEPLVKERYLDSLRHSDEIHPDDRDKLLQYCDDMSKGKPHICVEIRNKDKDGVYHWQKAEGRTVCDGNGNPQTVIARIKNIDARKEREEELRRNSEHDLLTGVWNHQQALEHIKRAFAGAKTGTGYLGIIDIDNFKAINDTQGYLIGDAVIGMVANSLESHFPKGIVGRIGGDEFIVYTDKQPKEMLADTLQDLQKKVKDTYRDRERGFEVSCSAGFAECDLAVCDFETGFAWADYALFTVRDKGEYTVLKADMQQEVPSGSGSRAQAGLLSRDEMPITTGDELVAFILELLGNASDKLNVSQMISERVCSFFGLDDIVYIVKEGGSYHKKYHWSHSRKSLIDDGYLFGTKQEWDELWAHLGKNNRMVMEKRVTEGLTGLTVGGLYFVHLKTPDDGDCCLIFVSRKKERDFREEKTSLNRIAGIFFKRMREKAKREKERQLTEYKIYFDPLTGLPRYQKFVELCNEYLQSNTLNCYIVYADILNFQYVNEFYGFSEGDKILKGYAEDIKMYDKCIYCTRVTSDHFIVLLRGKNMEEVRKSFLERNEAFCQRVDELYDQNHLVIVGGMSAVEAGEDVSYGIDRANSVRKYGKNTADTIITVYDNEIREKIEAQKAIVANMTTALDNGEFKAWLQPKVSLQTKKIVGAEALVRWQKPDGSMVYPDNFVPVFEKNGFITRIDFEVLNQITAYLREALDLGEEVVPISVNFSRRHNESPDFVDELLRRLEERSIPHKYIEAEITESVFLLDLETLTHNIQRLKDAGITISIDDFGSGYSSLNVLTNVKADIIKLDKTFLNYTYEDEKAPVFVKSLVKMMKTMGYKVIAEGVETEEQLLLLGNAECDMVQGYYYAKPMPIPQFREFLKEFNQ